MTHLIAGTRNKAKLAALQRLVGDDIHVMPPPHDISPKTAENVRALTAAEEGNSVEEIAAAKAVTWSRMVPGELVIASDGGLVIPALGDAWDPTRTRRFAGEGVPDLDRAKSLLALTAHLGGSDRRISWREAVAIARNGEVLGQWCAESEPGFLATEADPQLIADAHGFWVDTLWVCPESHDRRLAELCSQEKESRGDHWSCLKSSVRVFLHMNL